MPEELIEESVVEPEPTEPQDTTQDGQNDAQDGQNDAQDEPETFPRDYVHKLRDEAAAARVKAKKADGYAARLHSALVAQTGRLADPTDLPFDEAHLDDEAELGKAIDDLLARKPHLASRRPQGNIGQGPTPGGGTVSLADLLRAGAR